MNWLRERWLRLKRRVINKVFLKKTVGRIVVSTLKGTARAYGKVEEEDPKRKHLRG